MATNLSAIFFTSGRHRKILLPSIALLIAVLYPWSIDRSSSVCLLQKQPLTLKSRQWSKHPFIRLFFLLLGLWKQKEKLTKLAFWPL